MGKRLRLVSAYAIAGCCQLSSPSDGSSFEPARRRADRFISISRCSRATTKAATRPEAGTWARVAYQNPWTFGLAFAAAPRSRACSAFAQVAASPVTTPTWRSSGGVGRQERHGRCSGPPSEAPPAGRSHRSRGWRMGSGVESRASRIRSSGGSTLGHGGFLPRPARQPGSWPRSSCSAPARHATPCARWCSCAGCTCAVPP